MVVYDQSVRENARSNPALMAGASVSSQLLSLSATLASA